MSAAAKKKSVTILLGRGEFETVGLGSTLLMSGPGVKVQGPIYF